jgi:hypothetical protein
MAIEPITAVIPVQPIEPISPSDGHRDDTLLRARVTAMVSATVARLSIEGQLVDVETVKPLPVGSTLTFKAEWKDGQLRLLAQDAPRTAGAAPSQPAPATHAARPTVAPPATSVTPAIRGAQSAASFLGMPAPATAERPPAAASTAQPMAQPGRHVPAPSIGFAMPGGSRPQPIGPEPELAASGLNRPGTGGPQLPPAQGPAQGSAAPSPNVLAPVRTALAHIQAMAVEAMLSGLGNEEPASETPRAAATPPPQAAPVAGQRPPESGAQRTQTAASALAAAQLLDAPKNETASAEKAIAARVAGTTGTAETPPEAPRPERMVSFTVEVPLYLPGTEMPIRLHISREQRQAEQAEAASERSPSWIVRFSSESGGLGPIHAAISLVDEHVGVQLWAERDDTAEWFMSRSSELRGALQASNLQLDAVRVLHGNPQSLVSE